MELPETFQDGGERGIISEEMIDIAGNIQAIQNSIESGIPPTTLTADTVLVEADDFEDDTGKDETSQRICWLALPRYSAQNQEGFN
jgi:hypothetical protein